MFRTMLKSEIHRATVTRAERGHAGSVTVDPALMDAADLLPGEQVTVVDVTSGARRETYVVEGERGSGVLGVVGAHPGDVVHLVSYAHMADAEAAAHRPRVVRVDEHNRFGPACAPDPAGSAEPAEPAETADAAMLDALLQPES
jgi:aspartate 1-decarboxylase